ncbi:MAG: M14 family metallocarboxypeptidase [Paenibacillaceae bacterium]|nr:M14 family metallocarboxypeptidase [Paenibacillaceae bacterium]
MQQKDGKDQQRYVSRQGDTIVRVARRFGINTAALLAANPLLAEGEALRAGTELVVPSAVGLGESQPPPGRGLHADELAPYGFVELMDDVAALQRRFSFLHAETIGTSVLGRPIVALRIGTGRKEWFANAAMHANEWITAPLLVRFAADCTAALEAGERFRGRDMARLLTESSVWLVPLVNPDGVELVLAGLPGEPAYDAQLLQWNHGVPRFTRWKANIRGVDLNDQFPAGWETERDRRAAEGPGARDHGGPAPLSEPEAAALARFTRERDFRLVLAFHTQGREIYWNYRDYEPPEAKELAERFGRVSGYRPVKLSGSDAGYKDWFIAEYRRPGFTVELGFGVNPLPVSQLDDLYEEAAAILLAAFDA